MLTHTSASDRAGEQDRGAPGLGAQEVAQRRLEVARPGRPAASGADASGRLPRPRYLSVDRDVGGGHLRCSLDGAAPGRIEAAAAGADD